MGKKNKQKKRKQKQSPQPELSRVEPSPAAGTREEEKTSGGVIAGMRGMIRGGSEGTGFFRKRRPLWEWALWIAGIVGIYHLYTYLRPLR